MKTTIFPLTFILWVVNLCECSALSSQSLFAVEKSSVNAHSYVFMESIPGLRKRDDLKKLRRVASDHVHEVVFVIQQRNIPELTRTLDDLSNPASRNYGQYLTRDDVIEITSNPISRDVVAEFLRLNGASIVSESIGHEYLTATAPIGVWETLLNTEFSTYYLTEQDGHSRELIRTDSYWIPKQLDLHVAAVLNVVDFQHEAHSASEFHQPMPNLGETPSSPSDGIAFPGSLRRIHNMDSTSTGSQLSTQASFISYGAYCSQADLSKFQVMNSLTSKTSVTFSTNALHPDHELSATDSGDCSLNLQYMTATSPDSPTTITGLKSFWRDWLLTIANTVDIPLVIHINSGSAEWAITRGVHDAFTVQAIKLGAMGVTLVGPSGDNGVLSKDSKKSGIPSNEYEPYFPSSNPYVTSVGATMVILYNFQF